MKNKFFALLLSLCAASPAFSDYQVLLFGDSLFDNPVRSSVAGDIDQTWSFNTWFAGQAVRGHTISGVTNVAIAGTGLFYFVPADTNVPGAVPGGPGAGRFFFNKDSIINTATANGTQFVAAAISYGANDVAYLTAQDQAAAWGVPFAASSQLNATTYAAEAVAYLNFVADRLNVAGAPILWMLPHLEVGCNVRKYQQKNNAGVPFGPVYSYPFWPDQASIHLALATAAATYNATAKGLNHPVSFYSPDSFLTGHFDNSLARGVYPCDGTSPGVRYIMGPVGDGTVDIHFTPLGKSYMPYYLLVQLQAL